MSRRSGTLSRAVVWLFRVLLGGLFVFAACGKILHPAEFAAAIRKFHALPPEWSNLPAIVLPWIEGLAGLFLITGPWRRGAIVWLAGLLVAFEGLFVWALAQGLQVDCGCFGRLGVYMSVLAGDVGPVSLVRNLVLLAMAGWLWRHETRGLPRRARG